MWRVGIVTVSDRSSKGKQKDQSGSILKQQVTKIDGGVEAYQIIPDELEQIKHTLISLTSQCDLILTSGGTGLAQRDVTPEATRAVIDKEVPGLTEVMRLTTFVKTKLSILSRSVAGVRGTTLIINLPGSPRAVEECFDIIQGTLPHALQVLQGDTNH